MINLEKEKLSLMERETLVKEGELKHKISEANRSAWRSPLVVAVFAAAFGAFSNAGITYYNSMSERTLASLTAENDRILEMIKIGDPDQVKENLLFLVEAKLISEPETVEDIIEYYKDRVPGMGPGTSQTSRASFIEERSADIITIKGETLKLREFVLIANGTVTRSLRACWNGETISIKMSEIKHIKFLDRGNRSKNSRCSFSGFLVEIKFMNEEVHTFIVEKKDFTVMGYGQYGRWRSNINDIVEIKFD